MIILITHSTNEKNKKKKTVGRWEWVWPVHRLYMKRQRKGNKGIRQEEKKNRPISMHRTLELMPLCRCSPFSLSLTPLYNDDDKQQQQQ
jgi:hypothetical protein